MAHADGVARLHVSVAYSPRAGEVDEVNLTLEPGATVADALHASGLQARYPDAALDTLPVGVWGAFCRRDDVLRDRDRVELYRPLRVDPMEARRRRQRDQAATRLKAKR
jgi:putative ubiquitin-RnfH superfamily antitoxin RatB of RatAB toxin-antitoxin module